MQSIILSISFLFLSLFGSRDHQVIVDNNQNIMQYDFIECKDKGFNPKRASEHKIFIYKFFI